MEYTPFSQLNQFKLFSQLTKSMQMKLPSWSLIISTSHSDLSSSIPGSRCHSNSLISPLWKSNNNKNMSIFHFTFTPFKLGNQCVHYGFYFGGLILERRNPTIDVKNFEANTCFLNLASIGRQSMTVF